VRWRLDFGRSRLCLEQIIYIPGLTSQYRDGLESIVYDRLPRGAGNPQGIAGSQEHARDRNNLAAGLKLDSHWHNS
jgi:hypothetical protein